MCWWTAYGRGDCIGTGRRSIFGRRFGASAQLRRWLGHAPARSPEFQDCCRAELASNVAPDESLAIVEQGKPVTLLFGARDMERNNGVVLLALCAGANCVMPTASFSHLPCRRRPTRSPAAPPCSPRRRSRPGSRVRIAPRPAPGAGSRAGRPAALSGSRPGVGARP